MASRYKANENNVKAGYFMAGWIVSNSLDGHDTIILRGFLHLIGDKTISRGQKNATESVGIHLYSLYGGCIDSWKLCHNAKSGQDDL
jgi:hypothetical protein